MIRSANATSPTRRGVVCVLKLPTPHDISPNPHLTGHRILHPLHLHKLPSPRHSKPFYRLHDAATVDKVSPYSWGLLGRPLHAFERLGQGLGRHEPVPRWRYPMPTRAGLVLHPATVDPAHDEGAHSDLLHGHEAALP